MYTYLLVLRKLVPNPSPLPGDQRYSGRPGQNCHISATDEEALKIRTTFMRKDVSFFLNNVLTTKDLNTK